jgi:peptide/nickel transport system substrate-binding protein
MSVRLRPPSVARASATLAVSASLLLAAACSSTPSSPPATASHGGTVTFALPPGNAPNMIFPFFSSEFVGNANIDDFMFLMYRPLYWLDGTAFQVDESKSLAYLPAYNSASTAVTVRLKPWHWSNGEAISAADVAFFMGMLAIEKDNFWAYVPGQFPDNVASVSYDTSADSVTFHLKGPVNQTWFTDNELSQIEPMPMAWDLSGPGKSAGCSAEDPATEAKACAAAYKYLTGLAGNTSSYASNPLWQIVDGPWRLSSYSPGGTIVVLVPNTKYSGPDKPRISAFKTESFTSDEAEYSVLRSGTSLTVGYVPFVDAPTKSVGAAVGTNPVSGYTLEPWFNWADNYLDINYENPVTGPIEKQLYFRQAIQSLIDQKAWITAAFHGYAYADYGPAPPYPVTSYLSPYASSNPYPFSIAKARSYLTSHGWVIPASGPATCQRPGAPATDCGAGIAKGAALSFSMVYASGSESLAEEMQDLQSDARQAGIVISLRTVPINTIFSMDAPCAKGSTGCTWQMLFFGGPVSSQPYWYPDNGALFVCGALANTENYCNNSLDAAYPAVYSESGSTALYKEENFEIQQALIPYTPVQDAQLTEVSDRLGGYTQSGTMAIAPEDWYFKS